MVGEFRLLHFYLEEKMKARKSKKIYDTETKTVTGLLHDELLEKNAKSEDSFTDKWFYSNFEVAELKRAFPHSSHAQMVDEFHPQKKTYIDRPRFEYQKQLVEQKRPIMEAAGLCYLVIK